MGYRRGLQKAFLKETPTSGLYTSPGTRFLTFSSTSFPPHPAA